MEPLFKTAMKYTFEEYKKFNKAVMKKRINRIYISLVLLVFFAILLHIINPDTYVSLFLMSFIIIYPVMINVSMNNMMRKTYDTNMLIKDLTENIEFYEEHFIVKTEKSEAKVEYNNLHKILENKTNFYLMIADNQGYLVLKEKCDDNLIKFINELKSKKE